MNAYAMQKLDYLFFLYKYYIPFKWANATEKGCQLYKWKMKNVKSSPKLILYKLLY